MGRGKRINVSVEELKQMYDSGMTVQDIANLCECSPKSIYRYLDGYLNRRKGGVGSTEHTERNAL